MAQTQTVTNEGITELVKRMTDPAGTSASVVRSLVCLNDTVACTAGVASTYADPAGSAVHHTGTGLSIVDGTISQGTTNTSGDTITIDYVFTATGTGTASGIHICNDDNDVSFVECCFVATIPMSSAETLTIDAAIVIDQV